MDAGIEDREPLFMVEIGLGAIDVVTRAEGDAAPGGPADHARIERLAEPQHRRLMAKVLVDRERHARCLRSPHHFNTGLPIGCERLLYDDAHAMTDGQQNEIPMRLHPRRDIDEVQPLAGE